MKCPQRLLPVALLLLSACLVKKVPLTEDPDQTAAAYAVTRTFVSEFAQLHLSQVLDLASYPFFAEGDIYADRQALQEELAEQFDTQKPLAIEIKTLKLYTLEDLRYWEPEAYADLVEKGFRDEYLIVAHLTIAGNTEAGLILLRRTTEGVWRIAGVVRTR